MVLTAPVPSVVHTLASQSAHSSTASKSSTKTEAALIVPSFPVSTLQPNTPSHTAAPLSSPSLSVAALPQPSTTLSVARSTLACTLSSLPVMTARTPRNPPLPASRRPSWLVRPTSMIRLLASATSATLSMSLLLVYRLPALVSTVIKIPRRSVVPACLGQFLSPQKCAI